MLVCTLGSFGAAFAAGLILGAVVGSYVAHRVWRWATKPTT